jgi:hypothetical protein|tara:strand:+ start:942 stop:1268 length:327 start_codon:yes stop_codon:yes gene_type:complete
MANTTGKKFGGRKKGVPNAVTQDTRIAYRNFVEGRLDSLNEWMDRVAKKDPDKALDFMLKFSEYFIPKLARTEIANEDGKEFVINIVNYANTKKLCAEAVSVTVDEGD